MPIFLYRHPTTQEVREVIQSVHEEHSYTDESGLKWEREFTVPTSSIDSNIDPFDHKRGLEKLKNTKGSLGDLQDFAKIQSDRREEKLGTQDPIKKKAYDDYAAKRDGKRSPQERAEKVKKLTKEVMVKFKSKLK